MFKAHRLLYHSTQDLRVIKKKKMTIELENWRVQWGERGQQRPV